MKNATDFPPMERIAVINALRDQATSLYREWFISKERDKGTNSALTNSHARRILETLNALARFDEAGTEMWLNSLAHHKPRTLKAFNEIRETNRFPML